MTKTTPAALIKALQSLRKPLTSTSAPFPYGIAYVQDTAQFPEVAAVNQAAAAAHVAWQDPDIGSLEDMPALIAPRRVLQDIGRFLRDEVGHLDRLPAPPSILNKLDMLIEDLGGKKSSQPVVEPLTESQKEVDDFIRNHDGPVTGKEIENHFGREPKSFDRILRILRDARGLRNKLGAGYYFPSSRKKRAGMT